MAVGAAGDEVPAGEPQVVQRAARLRHVADGGVAARHRPAQHADRPLRGGSRPRIARISVVLPEPFGPSTPTNSSSRIARSMSARTVLAPNASVTPANSTALTMRMLPAPARPRSSSPIIQSWKVLPAGSVSVTPTTGIFALLGDPHQALRRGVGRLAVVEQQARTWCFRRSFSKAATSDTRGSVSFITASWKRSLRILKPSAVAM